MSDFLAQMAAGSRERLEAARRARSEAALLQTAQSMPPAAQLVTHAARFDLIAELKLRSPAVGQLKAGTEDVAARVTTYARAGAAAVSVLTEPSRFDGSMDRLQQATEALAPLNVPAMRKDFLIDPYQVLEARVAGAGGVLVIIRMMSRSGIQEMLECASQLGLFVLLEAFDEADIEVMHQVLAPGAGPRRHPGPATGAAVATGGLTPVAPVLAGTAWLAIHVPIIMVSYATLAIVTLFAHVVVGVEIFAPHRREMAKRWSQLAYWYIHVGSILLITGILTGSIWAASSWGRYWGWDPKEVWSLVAFLAYMAILHARFDKQIEDFGVAVGAIAAFWMILMTYLGVNYVLAAGLHSYGFGSSNLVTIMAVIALVEIAFLAAGWMAVRRRLRAA